VNNIEKLKGQVVKFYYERHGHGAKNVPDGFLGIATICLVRITNSVDNPLNPLFVPGSTARGISFCNPKDQFNKKFGRHKALGRAVKALENRAHSELITSTSPASILHPLHGWRYLSDYAPILTDREVKLLIGGKLQ